MNSSSPCSPEGESKGSQNYTSGESTYPHSESTYSSVLECILAWPISKLELYLSGLWVCALALRSSMRSLCTT